MTARLAALAVLAAAGAADADDASLEDVRAEIEMANNRIDRLEPLAMRLSGWLDVSFFAVGGDGSGVRRDVGHAYFPEYDGRVPGAWVFMGDPLSTAVNARGEPADTGDSRAVTMDSIDAGGHPSALVNALTVAIDAGVTKRVAISTLLDVVPRSRDPSEASSAFGLGDFVDLKLAQVSWLPDAPFAVEIYGGKILSVLGIEYRSEEAPERLAVTPSLVCRYTCGHPLGAGAFAFLPGGVMVNLALTNGSYNVEQFPFQREIDANDGKTAAARIGWLRRGDAGSLEVGVSGAFGAQDAQVSDAVVHWQAGLDLNAEWRDFLFAGEFVKGNAEGRTTAGVMARCDLAPCLDYKAAYGMLAHRTRRWLWPYLRVDWRDALHENGTTFVYVSRLVRGTLGLHCELGQSVIAKAEYTLNREVGGIPQFPNDVFTTSLVVKY